MWNDFNPFAFMLALFPTFAIVALVIYGDAHNKNDAYIIEYTVDGHVIGRDATHNFSSIGECIDYGRGFVSEDASVSFVCRRGK